MRIKKSIELFEEMLRNVKQLNESSKELMDNRGSTGVSLCTGSKKYYLDEIHIFSGIELLAEHYGKEISIRDFAKNSFDEDVTEHSFYLDDIKIFQLYTDEKQFRMNREVEENE